MADFGGIWENLSGKFLSMYLYMTYIALRYTQSLFL